MFVIKRNEGETWRECVLRYSAPWGLEQECLAEFYQEIARGTEESKAAFEALYEWDCLDYVKDSST